MTVNRPPGLAEMVLDASVSNADFARYVIAHVVADAARQNGVRPPGAINANGELEISADEEAAFEGFVASVLAKLPAAEAHEAANSAVEKAIHKALRGDLETAGRLLREHLLDGARNLAIEQALGRDRAKRKQGGLTRSQQQAKRNAERNAKIVEKHDDLLRKGTKERDVAGKLSIAFSPLTPGAIRRILRKAGRS